MLRPTQVGRYQLTVEADLAISRQHAVIDARRGDLDGACSGHDAAERPMAVTDDLPMPVVIHQILVPLEEQLDFDIQGSLEQGLRPASDDLIQRQERQTSVWTGGR